MSEKYNGWSNYETWLANLCSDSDYLSEQALECLSEAIEEEIDVHDARSTATDELAARLKEEQEGYIEEIIPSAGLMAGLLNAALSEINWYEIASYYVDDVDIYCVGFNMPGYLPDSDPCIFLDFGDAKDSLKETFENHCDDDESIGDEQIEEIISGVSAWTSIGNTWSFTFGNYCYWISKN